MRLVVVHLLLVVLSGTALAADTQAAAKSAEAKDVAEESTSPIVRAFKQTLEAVERAGNFGFVLLLCFFFVVVCLSLPTTPIELSAGFMYGAVWGCVAGVIGKTVGCLIAFLLARTLGEKWGLKVPQALESRLGALKSQPLMTMIGIRVAPLPLGLKNYGLAMCNVPAASYVMASLVVNIPFSCLWASLGSSCHSLGDALNFDTSKVSILGAVPVWGQALLAGAVLVGVGFLVRRHFSSKQHEKKG